MPDDETQQDDGPQQEADDMPAAKRVEQQTLWVDFQVRNAIARGDFDNLPGAGKPIRGLDGRHDPDWWVKGLVEREKLTGLAPPAIGLRKDDAELDEQLDRQSSEAEVRRMLADFNTRVLHARRQLLGGPPVITQPRDVEQAVGAWRERRVARAKANAERVREQRSTKNESGRAGRRWWRRG
jgi:Domain of unknown function (DUF1992)